MDTSKQLYEYEAKGWERGIYEDIKQTFRAAPRSPSFRGYLSDFRFSLNSIGQETSDWVGHLYYELRNVAKHPAGPSTTGSFINVTQTDALSNAYWTSSMTNDNRVAVVSYGTFYFGSTQDVESRLQRHNQGRSQHTKSKRPWKSV